MRSVETTGKTLEEAREAALQELQATAEQVEFETLEEPKRLLGFLGAQAEFRVRATVREDSPGGEAVAEAAEAPPETVTGDDSAVDDAGRRAQEFLAETTRLMGLDTEVVITGVEAGEIALEIQGPSLGLLIGRHGATLDALQLLAAVVANGGADRGARIIVDAEDYRERRREMLRKMALAHAEKAKKRGQEVVIPDLKPFERRIVHLALKEDPEVETYSEGEGEDRCLVISPRTP